MTLSAFGQNEDLLETMIQGCLSDSTFEYNLLQDSDFGCKDNPTYHIPYSPTDYSGDLRFNLAFNGKVLAEHNYSDSTKCEPFQISSIQKSRSRYQVTVSLSIFVPLACEHLEGHGKNHGCVSKKVLSVSRKIKVKKNGELKVKKSEYRNYRMTGTFL